jgi:hypothetical protein
LVATDPAPPPPVEPFDVLDGGVDLGDDDALLLQPPRVRATATAATTAE